MASTIDCRPGLEVEGKSAGMVLPFLSPSFPVPSLPLVQTAMQLRRKIRNSQLEGEGAGYGPVERKPIRTATRQKESPTERKAQFEPVYNKLCVGTVFAASGNVTTET